MSLLSRESRGTRASMGHASRADITDPSEHTFLQSPDGTWECVAAQDSRMTLPIDPGCDSNLCLAGCISQEQQYYAA